MKSISLIMCLLIMLIVGKAEAVSPTPTPQANPTSESATEKLSDQINTLKEKIASRVAQLKLVEKRGILGTVKEVSGTTVTLDDITGKTRLVDVDEITKFSSPSANNSFGLSDLKNGTKVSVIGLYNKDSQRLLARFINSYTLPLYISGTVNDINTTDFTLNLAMEEGKSYIVDIENLTKTTSYSDTTAEKSGFSKIEKGTRVMVIGYADRKEKNRMVATRILLFPGLPKNPRVVVAPNAVDTSEKTVTSTGSGKKLTPVR